MKRLMALVFCTVGLTACGGGITLKTPATTHPVSEVATTASPAERITPPIQVVGTLDLTDTSPGGITGGSGGPSSCTGTGGYNDITGGAEVVISDDAGKTLTIVSLTPGTYESSTRCQFSFFANIPAGLGFYGIAVGHRGLVKFTEADMKHPGLTLGS
jgi:hypothetical protein